MGEINIKINGNEISGNAGVLNNMKVSGDSNVRVEVGKSIVRDNAEALNNMKVSEDGNVNVKVAKSTFRDNARVLNNMEVQEDKLEIDVENLEIGENVEFMDNKFKGNKPKESKENTSAKETVVVKQSHKKSLLRRILDKLIGEDKSEKK